jgi:hypothetical protein
MSVESITAQAFVTYHYDGDGTVTHVTVQPADLDFLVCAEVDGHTIEADDLRVADLPDLPSDVPLSIPIRWAYGRP